MFYTHSVATLGKEAVKAKIDSCITSVREAFQRSNNIPVGIRLVHARELPTTQDGQMFVENADSYTRSDYESLINRFSLHGPTNDNLLPIWQQVGKLTEAYKADVTVLLGNMPIASTLGVAYNGIYDRTIEYSYMLVQADAAVVQRETKPGMSVPIEHPRYTFAHELGHILGAVHENRNPLDNVPSYTKGILIKEGNTEIIGDIMTEFTDFYNVPYYSSPSVQAISPINKQPYTLGVAGERDIARAFTEVLGSRIAKLRGSIVATIFGSTKLGAGQTGLWSVETCLTGSAGATYKYKWYEIAKATKQELTEALAQRDPNLWTLVGTNSATYQRLMNGTDDKAIQLKVEVEVQVKDANNNDITVAQIDEVFAGAGDSPAQIYVEYDATRNPPVFSGFSPESACPGQQVTITGMNFIADLPMDVFFGVDNNGMGGVKSLSVQKNAAGTSMTAVIPPNAASGKIKIMNDLGSALSASEFTVNPISVISMIAPTKLFAAEAVTLTGQYLDAVTNVAFGAINASILSPREQNSLVFTVPQLGNTIPNDFSFTVSTPCGPITPVQTITVIPGSVSILNFTPTTQCAGNTVVINGDNFFEPIVVVWQI